MQSFRLKILFKQLYKGEKTWTRHLKPLGLYTHTHTHTRHFLTEEKENTCNEFSAGSCSYTQNLINDEWNIG